MLEQTRSADACDAEPCEGVGPGAPQRGGARRGAERGALERVDGDVQGAVEVGEAAQVVEFEGVGADEGAGVAVKRETFARPPFHGSLLAHARSGRLAQ